MPRLTGLPRHGQPIEYLTDEASPLVWETPKFSILQARLCKVLLSSCRIKGIVICNIRLTQCTPSVTTKIGTPTFFGIITAAMLMMAI